MTSVGVSICDGVLLARPYSCRHLAAQTITFKRSSSAVAGPCIGRRGKDSDGEERRGKKRDREGRRGNARERGLRRGEKRGGEGKARDNEAGEGKRGKKIDGEGKRGKGR